jgi:acetyl-CoA carboxylase biotin carboxyl carrier protein
MILFDFKNLNLFGGKMNLDEIQKLLKMIDESGMNEMSIEEGEFKITLKRHPDQTVSSSAAPMYMPSFAPQAPAAPTVVSSPAAKVEAAPAGVKYKEIRSPMVGTFYRAPSPEANSYVQVGDSISKNKVLCIIEAMKLMNEIESDIDGKIVKILVENGQPVEYDQVLFLVE